MLASLDHVVSRRGAYLAYIGSGEHAVRLRVLGADVARARRDRRSSASTCRVALPLLPGDRYVLRESGRDETVGGGEVLDVAPVLPASRARPDRGVDRVVAERGWVDADELELLTGERRGRRRSAAGSSPRRRRRDAAVDLADRARRRRAARRSSVAALDERQRAVLATLDDVVVDGGRRPPAPAGADPLAGHPALAALAAGGLAPAGARRHRPGRAARAGPARRARRARRACGSTPTPSRPPPTWPPRLLAEQPGGLHRRRVPRRRRHHPQARRAAARRARRPGRSPAAAATCASPAPACRRDLSRSAGPSDADVGGSEARRSSWFRPPQMP